MTVEEFSNAFDTLLNSYSINANFGEPNSKADIVLDEYEKSLYLTEAQEQIVVELYTGRGKVASFEQTEELRSNLRGLIKTAILTESEEPHSGLSDYSKFFTLPPDLLFITYESARLNDESLGCKNSSTISVVPVTQDEFYRATQNPFKQANTRRALRLDYDNTTVEIVSKTDIKDYVIRYLSKPTPIIVGELSEISIDGYKEITECELDSSVHRLILDRAVALALSSRSPRVRN